MRGVCGEGAEYTRLLQVLKWLLGVTRKPRREALCGLFSGGALGLRASCALILVSARVRSGTRLPVVIRRSLGGFSQLACIC